MLQDVSYSNEKSRVNPACTSLRVAARFQRALEADLQPPLGNPGGPCHVVRRIDEEIRNPRLKEQLIDDVERGKSLSNPDAAKVYDLEVEAGAGPIRKLKLTAHVQYRMDLRSVTVNDVRATLAGLGKTLMDWKARGSPGYRNMTEQIARGDKIEWVDPRTKLKLVFAVEGDAAVLITAFWKGREDPPPPRSECPLPRSSQ